MSANFNFYLNRQGPKGRKGDKGEQGYSPSISVETETAAEYILKIQNEGYSFTTPNLRGNAIENTGGTYIRFNPETEEWYTGGLDSASSTQLGAVLITASGRLEQGGSSGDVPTSAEVYDYVESRIASIGGGYVTEATFNTYVNDTAITLNNLATQKISFTDLSNTLVEGDNITLDVDSENGTITINASGGDLSNYVTLDTPQMITGAKTFYESGSVDHAIVNSPFNIFNSTGTKINIGSNSQSGGLIVSGKGLTLGTKYTGASASTSNSIYLPYNNKNAYIIESEEYYAGIPDSYILPIFTAKTLIEGNGISITSNGTGLNKTYTISSSPDLSGCVKTTGDQTISGFKTFLNSPILKGITSSTLEFDNGNNNTEVAKLQYTFDNNRFTISSEGGMYLQTSTNSINVDDLLTSSKLTNVVTTNTAQTITGSKTFTTNLNLQETSPCINFKAGAGQTMGYVRFDATGQTMRLHSNGIMYIETNQHSGTNAINVDNLVVQSNIAAKENTSNKVTSISSASTDTEYPSAKCVYDAIQSELGNITTLLNNINSGSGS